MKVLPIVAMAMLAGNARAETGAALEHVVPVCMSEGVRTPDMYLARAIVSEVFEKIGVNIEWRFQERLCRSLSGVISIELSSDTPKNHFPGALAYALPFEGTHIIVFYDRVKGAVQGMLVPHLVALVLAHEIRHVIEGTDVPLRQGCDESALGFERRGADVPEASNVLRVRCIADSSRFGGSAVKG